jgi:hypothetical protein
MATSSVHTITVTATNLIKSSLRAIGAAATGETPEAPEIIEAIEALNYLIKNMEGPPNFLQPGMRMWQRESGLLTLVANQSSYSLKPTSLVFTSGGTYTVSPGDTITGATSAATAIVEKVTLSSGTWGGGDAAGTLTIYGQSGTFQAENLNVGSNSNVATIAADSSGGDLDIQIPIEILTAVLRHTTSNSDTPLEPLTLEQYQAIGNKSSSVTPTAYYYEKRLTEGKLYLNGQVSTAAASAYKISFVYRQPLEVIDAQADELDIETSYYRALKWALAKELSPEYGKPITPDIRELAAESLALAQTFQPEGRVKNINSQRSVNFFPYPDPTGKKIISLHHTPGLLEWWDLNSTVPIRAMHTFNDILYFIGGNTLYKVTKSGETITQSTIGTILTHTGNVWMEDNRSQLMITDDLDGYILQADGSTFGAIADGNFPTPTSLAYQDGYFFVTKSASDRVHICASLDGLTWDATEYKVAGARPDKGKVVHSHSNNIFVIGERSTEIWYNSGDADFPFDLLPGAVFEFGTAASASVASSKTGDLLFLGDDLLVRRFVGLTPEVVTPPQVSYQFSTYATISDAYAYVFHMEGQVFYTITFPSAKRTWLYNLASGFWNEWNSYPNNDRHRSSCYAYFDNKHLVGDFSNGKIYQLDLGTYADDGNEIVSYRTAQAITAERRNFFNSSLEVEFESGVGLITGQGSDPQAMLTWSDDGGHTWSNEHWRDIGSIGRYKNRARWNKLGVSRDRIYKVSISDPVKKVIISAHLEAQMGIH